LLRGEKTDDDVVRATVEQVDLALAAAHAILLVVDAQEGIVPLDREVAQRLRRASKPVLVVANKVDHAGVESALSDFTELGFERLFPISAIHGRGIEPLIEAAVALLPAEAPSADAPGPGVDQPSAAVKLAVVGRPNVGKSSLVNALTRSERVIVSPVPGTTRDAIDVPLEVETDGRRERYVLIDTAGIRKTRSVADSIEFFSVKRAEHSIERCDLVVFMLDAESGIREQDKKIADRIVEARKGCIVVVNKWDLFEADVLREQQRARKPGASRPRGRRPLASLAQFGQWVQEKLFFLDYAPVIFTSARSGFHLDRLLEAIRYVATQLQKKVPTAILNRTLHDAIERRQPVSAAGSRMKFYYATQVRQAPPTFLLFVNRAELSSPVYEKYLAGQLRQAFGYEGCPIVLVPRSRPQTIAPKRKHRTAKADASE
jgi:GTP-binding protein